MGMIEGVDIQRRTLIRLFNQLPTVVQLGAPEAIYVLLNNCIESKSHKHQSFGWKKHKNFLQANEKKQAQQKKQEMGDDHKEQEQQEQQEEQEQESDMEEETYEFLNDDPMDLNDDQEKENEMEKIEEQLNGIEENGPLDWIQLARVENNQPKKLTKILEYEYDYICRPKQLENLGLFQFRSFWSKRKIPKENTKKKLNMNID